MTEIALNSIKVKVSRSLDNGDEIQVLLDTSIGEVKRTVFVPRGESFEMHFVEDGDYNINDLIGGINGN